MVQLQFLNYILATKDYDILLENDITEDYFTEYVDEFAFIKNHYQEYKSVPDIATFVDNFPSFDVLDVTESKLYLINTIREEYLYSKSVPIIKKAAELLKSDANEASRYLQSEMINLSPNYSIPSVGIIHSDHRIQVFEEKANNPDKWFIPTGFEELDEIINGWQMGEELGVIYARTGECKSWFVAKSAQHSWLMGKNVGYMSPEMSADKIGYRFDTVYKHLSNTALIRGKQDVISLDLYKEYFNELKQAKNDIFVSTPLDFNKKVTVSKLRNWVRQNKLDILIIDGIKYLSDERYKKGDNTTTSLTNISEDLMQLSIEMKIPVLVVVQSNRGGVKEDPDATPELENIRDSDGIAHNATKVIALRKKEDSLIVEIKKHRDGGFGNKLVYSCDIDTGNFVFFGSEERKSKTQNENENTNPKSKPKKSEKKVVF